MNFNLNYEGFEKNLNVKERHNGGIHYVFEFENGYGASVVKGPFTYGGPEDLWELAALRYNDIMGKWTLDYSTEITNDVEGYLFDREVLELLARVKSLKKPER